MTRPKLSEAGRFLVAGGANTLLTYIIYLVFLQMTSYVVAYSASYLVGIALAYLFYTAFVFRTKRTVRRALLFPLTYAVQYLLGLAALHIAIRYIAVPKEWALVASIAITIPTTFLLSRMILVIK